MPGFRPAPSKAYLNGPESAKRLARASVSPSRQGVPVSRRESPSPSRTDARAKPSGLVVRNRMHGLRVIEPDEFVELIGQSGVEVVARQLGVGSIDHADRAFQSRDAPAPAKVGLARLAQTEERRPRLRRS